MHALNGLLARLDRALGAQRAFIADAAHELRTPLTAVHLQAQLAERAATDAERARGARASCAPASTRATHLVEQLLTLAREEPGVAERRFAPVDLARARARASSPSTRAIAAARGVDLGMAGAAADAAAAPSSSTATPHALRALLSNLVDNAVRYTPAGGRVDVARRRDDGDARRSSVRDSGPGHPGERARARVRPLLPRAAPARRTFPAAASASRSSSASPSATAPRIDARAGNRRPRRATASAVDRALSCAPAAPSPPIRSPRLSLA